MKKKTICIDFDGVISSYFSWQGRGKFGDILPGCKEAMLRLKAEGWVIIIYTTRSELDLIGKYLYDGGIIFDSINYNPENAELGCNLGKPLADVYLDDRGVCFTGSWEKALADILSFEPWYKKK